MRRWLIVLALMAFVSWQMWPAGADEPQLPADPNDGDGDGWTDGYEFTYIGTAPGLRCEPEDYLPGRVGAWPPDFNRDNFVTGFDLSVITFNIGQLLTIDSPVEMRRLDIGNEPMGDAVITAADLQQVAARIGTVC